MANRKVLIESILGLAQKLGANPNKFMGTKSNINFLGTGDKGMKGTTFSGQLNEDFLDLGFGKSDMIKIIEQDAGYVTAGKLNDVQLNTMFNNLKMIDETFNPPPGPLNVIDLETGTRNINKEGLESLRETDKIKRFTQGLRTSKTAMSDKIKEGIESIKTKLTRDYGGDEIATKATAENNFIRSGAADFTDFVSAEGGRRAVIREVMKNNSNYFGLTPEIAESIAKSKDLGKGGSNFPDPLIVFRNKGLFTKQELEKIDEIIEANPFDDVKVIADKVSDYVQSIRPDGFAEGGRIGFKSGGIGRLMGEGIKTALKRTRKGYDTPGADFQVLTQSDSYLMSPPNMQMLEKLKIVRRQLVRDIKRKEGGGKYTFGPDPKATKKDLQSLDEYIAELMKKIGVEGYYGEGRAAEKALLESDPSLPFSKLVKDRYRSADGGRIGYRSGKSVKGIAELLKLGKGQLKTADKIDRPASAKLNDEFKAFNERRSEYGGPRSDDYYRKSLETEELVNVDELPIELLDAEAIMVKYPGITERLARLIGGDTNLQRKAEALSAIDQAMALRGAGKSADETIEILKREPKTKMKKRRLSTNLGDVMEEFNKYVSYYTEGEYKNLDEILDKDLRRKIYNRARVQLERNNGKFVKPLKRGFDINAKEFNKGAKYYSEQPEFKIKKGTKFRNLPLIIRNKIRYNTYRNDNKFVPPKTPAEALKKSIPKKMQERIKLMIGEETPLDFKKYTYGVSKSLEGDGTKGGVKNPFYERARYWGNKREKSIENSIKRLAELRNKYGNFPLGVLDPKKAVWHDLFRGAVILKGDYGDLPVNKRFKLITKIPKAKENGKPDWKKNDAWRDAKFKDTVTGKIITYDNLEKITNDPKLGGPGAYQKAIQTAKNRRALYDAAIPIDGKKITLSGALVSKDLATNNRTPSTGIESHHFGEGGVKRNYWDTQLTTRESNRQLQYKQKSFLNKLNKTNDPNKILELRKGFDKFVTELPGGINYTFEGKIAGVTPTAGSVVSSLSQEKGLLKYPGIRDLITAIGSAKGKNLEVICRAIGKKSDGGISTTCAEAISDIKNNPANAATKLEGLKPTSAVLGKVRNAASAFLKFAGKGKTFAITAGVGAGAGALVKAFRNDDPETYLTNDKQANAMILDTADQLEREERQAAVGDAPELLDESAIGAELAVTGAAVPGSKKLFDARKKKGFGAVRAGLGPVGKALSGFATPLGIAATTPLNVASQVYAGDSAEEILTDPLNYLGPAFAGTLTKEATRGMNPTGMLSKALRLGMNPATIRAGSKFLGLPGLALSLGYEGYDQYKKYTEGRGFVYNLLNKDE